MSPSQKPLPWPEEWLPDRTWQIQNHTLTGRELRDAYDSLCNTEEIQSFLQALHVGFRSHRKADRALSLLKGKGLITFVKESNKWIPTHLI